MNIQDYYKYAQFSTLAYVNWRKRSGLTSDEAIEDASNPENPRIPGDISDASINSLGEKIFKSTAVGGQGWRVADFHPNDPSGFKASFFINESTGEKVLAISGTESSEFPYVDLIMAGRKGDALIDLSVPLPRLKKPIMEKA